MNNKPSREYGRVWALLVTIVLLFAFFGGIVSAAIAASKVDYPTKTVLFIAPSKPGSGFDTTARAIAATITQEKLIPVALPVQNASGSVEGTAEIVLRHKNDPYMIAVQSIAGLQNYATGMSPYSHRDFTPIARLISAYYGILVRNDSPYKTLGQLIKDLKENPGKTPLSGGTSDDRVCYGALFLKAGVDISKINYAAFSGGTEASTVVLEGSAKAMVSTIDDVMGLVEAKELRPLAVSPGKRLGGVLQEYPTFRESGVDLDWENFRYVLGGPNMPDYAVKYWREILMKMVKTPTWQKMLEKYRWGDTFMIEGLDKFLDERQAIVTDVMTRLGMAKKKH
jgi:putative tricarboxylic transport membrane protein